MRRHLLQRLLRRVALGVCRVPAEQRREADRVPLPEQRLLRALVQLLGLGQAADRGVQVAQEALGVGVDLLALLAGEEELLALVGARGAQVGSARLGGGEVGAADIAKLCVKVVDVCILEEVLVNPCSRALKRFEYLLSCKPL